MRALPQFQPALLPRGCNTCMSCNNSCDGRWPSCKTCESLGWLCGGYHYTDDAMLDEVDHATIFGCDGVASTKTHPTVIIYDGFAAPAIDPAGGVGSECQTSSNLGVVSRSWVEPSPAAPPTQDPWAVYASFFLSGFKVPWDPVRQEVYRWFPPVLDRLSSNPAGNELVDADPLTLSAAALAEGHFGKVQRHMGIVQQNYGTYGTALSALSRRLAQFQQVAAKRGDVHEWRNLTLACCGLILWELRMNPNGPNWKNHAGGLAYLVGARPISAGPVAPSEIEFLIRSKMIVLFGIMSSNSLADESYANILYDNEIVLPTPEAGQAKKQHALDSEIQVEIIGPPDRVNHVLNTFQSAVIIRRQYQKLWDARVKSATMTETQFAEQLATIHFRASAILRQAEAVTKHWESRNLRVVGRAKWQGWTLADDAPVSLVSREADIHCLLDEVFDFPNLYELHVMSMSRLTALVLHLIHCDILRNLPPGYAAAAEALWARHKGKIGLVAGETAVARSLAAHRVSLVGHAKAVVKGMPWLSQRNVFNATLINDISCFNVTRYAMMQECEALRIEGMGMDGQVLSLCEALESLSGMQINWNTRFKISLRLDFDENWPRSSP